MKRKFVNAILFGALIAASTSVVQSCKDYDDDISDLQSQITNNASTLDEMVTEKVNNLTAEIASLKSQQSALETALAASEEKLTAAIEEAKSAANNAEAAAKAYADVQAAAAEKAAIEAAQASIDSAVQQLQGAIDAANATINELNSKVSTQQETINGLLDADAKLQTAISEANAEIATAKDMATAAQQTADENAEQIDAILLNLQTVKEGLDSQISLLSEDLKKAMDDIAANKADVEAKLATVNSLIESNAEAIAALQSKDTELLELITKNSTDLTALAGQVALMNEELTANLDAVKAYAEAEIALLKGDVETIKGDLAAALTQISNIQTSLEAINAAIEEQKGINENTSADIKKLQEELQALTENVEENISNLVLQIGGINSTLESVIGGVDLNTTNLKTLQEAVEQINAQLQGVATKEDVNKLIEDLLSASPETLKAFEAALKGYTDQAINDNNAELAENLQNLQDQIDAINGADGLKGEIDALRTQIGLIQGDEGVTVTIQEQINQLSTSLEEAKTAASQALAGEVSTLNQTITDLQSALETRIGNVENEISEIWKQLAVTSDAIGQCINMFNDELSKYSANLSKQLKSIVFSPQEYYQGIEAIGIWSFNYNAIVDGIKSPDLTKDQTDDHVKRRATDETSVSPIVKASYYMNPSNAAIDTVTSRVKEHYSFIVNNASYTRSASENQITIDSVRYDKSKKGLFNVFFSMKDANKIASIPETGDGSVDVAALRYNYSTLNGDTVITSDFAALKQYKITDFVINKGNSLLPLAKSAKGAIAKDANGEYTYPTLEIAYDNKAGIDLDDYINVYYKYNNSQDYKFWGYQDEINKKKFKLVYELIGYKATDADETNESQHATITGSVLTVHNVGTTEADRRIIGRTPLVRVKLIDENSGEQLAEVGYIIVKIKDVASEPVVVEEIDAIEGDYTVVCENEIVLNNARAISWLEVENKVLGELNMSKDEFEANYALEENGDGSCKQFTQNSNGGFAERTTQFGSIVNTTDDQSHTTNVLKWTVRNNQAYDWFVTKKNTSISVWVKFAPTNTLASSQDVYVKLTWTPATRNIEPVATINDSDKKAADWHATNSREAGFDELHIQVGNATVPGATCEYQSMVVKNTFNVDPLDIIKRDLGSTYKPLADNANVYYRFASDALQTKKSYTGVSGTSYAITVRNVYDEIPANNISEIYAGRTLIASMEVATGTVTLAPNDVAKDIINNYNKGELSKALTFTVVVENTTCAPAKNLIAWKPLNCNKFDVKVIKPVFIVGGEISEMTLNDFSSLTQKVSLKFEDFNGYDPTAFWNNSNKQVTFWDFYEVSSIEAEDIQTDYSGSWKPVDTNDFEFNYTKPNGGITLDNMGSVKLVQKNMSRANAFNVRINFKVTYSWGTLYYPVTVKVNAAPGNTVSVR